MRVILPIRKAQEHKTGKGCASQQVETAAYSIALTAPSCRNRKVWVGKTIPRKGNGHYEVQTDSD